MQENQSALPKLDNLLGGAAAERFDHVLAEVLENVFDINTPYNKARKITLTISIKPDEDREKVEMSFDAKSTLAPRKTIKSMFFIGKTDAGEIVAKEITKQIPGQLDLERNETAQRTEKLIAIK